MTDERRELLRLLEQISDLYPAMRFGQVVEAVAAWSGEHGPVGVYDVTDAEMLSSAKRHLAKKQSALPRSVA